MFSFGLNALFLLLVLAVPTGTASAAERPDRPVGKVADPVSECSPEMIGEWICGKIRYMKISFHVGEDGITRVNFTDGWLSGEGRRTHTDIVDGKAHVLKNGTRYASSCNHKIKTRKIYRRAARDATTGRVLIGDYIVLEDGRMLIGLFSSGKMEGYDVRNSSRPSEPDSIVECIRCIKTGC